MGQRLVQVLVKVLKELLVVGSALFQQARSLEGGASLFEGAGATVANQGLLSLPNNLGLEQLLLFSGKRLLIHLRKSTLRLVFYFAVYYVSSAVRLCPSVELVGLI